MSSAEIKNCVGTNEDKYLIDPFEDTVAGCEDQLTDIDQDKKLKFICEMDQTPVPILTYVSIIISMVGCTLVCISCCLMCKYRCDKNSPIMVQRRRE